MHSKYTIMNKQTIIKYNILKIKIYDLETKIQIMNLLNQCNFDCIEFGSYVR